MQGLDPCCQIGREAVLICCLFASRLGKRLHDISAHPISLAAQAPGFPRQRTSSLSQANTTLSGNPPEREKTNEQVARRAIDDTISLYLRRGRTVFQDGSSGGRDGRRARRFALLAVFTRPHADFPPHPRLASKKRLSHVEPTALGFDHSAPWRRRS